MIHSDWTKTYANVSALEGVNGGRSKEGIVVNVWTAHAIHVHLAMVELLHKVTFSKAPSQNVCAMLPQEMTIAIQSMVDYGYSITKGKNATLSKMIHKKYSLQKRRKPKQAPKLTYPNHKVHKVVPRS